MKIVWNITSKSVGPRGIIRKVVTYEEYNVNRKMFNLGFGDRKEIVGGLDDFAISNNSDRDMVLATVGMIVLAFLWHFPERTVIASGSTPARTRLYQMGICANLKHLEMFLTVEGYRNGRWELFKPNVKYESFKAKKKTAVNL